MADVARTILCFGDSNTHGTVPMPTISDKGRHAKQHRWPSVMAAAFPPDWDIVAEGHPGRTAVWDDPIEGAHKNGARVIQAILETHRPIDLVILMLGTNDLKARFGVSASDIALGIQRLVTDIFRSDCGPDAMAPDIIMAAPVAVQEVGIFEDIFAGAAERSLELPQHLKEVACRHGTGFVDLNSVANVDPIDGIHLSKDAHAAIGAAMAHAVADRLNCSHMKGAPHAQRN
ncbi:GDSL-type esterase/lipase family protein [uncultured Tateyamaria sp.]|uniref:GDSL-type esterase/lipase family protein n=1 Tax=uncultured Tateyamaria sp. TaxID=455651 RepID=UPI0026257FA7|nr:GDSL-type esterase/lipase family protein [uncultured Tateyamaria sp.]